ncbi:MAG: pyridoxal phosphate-dependent aminotransferase [Candidatus Omnitrophica bacterium]|nr:pyridoxal phosphate-dependent aminotransferase [Candidatus Omnitrophota bacterium]
MPLNPRVLSLSKSATLKITALTKKLIREGKDVVNFAAGEPDFDTPDFIKQEAIKAINHGFTKYTPSAGVPALREAIAQKLNLENKIPLKPEGVIVTSGAKYAVYVALSTLLEDNQEVIIPSPYWVSYPEMVKLAGAKASYLAADEKDNFKINPLHLEKAINHKTKILILNYPSNPTGITYTYEDLKAISAIVKKRRIYVISDEIYEALLYDGLKHYSFAALPDMFERTITINGFSKAFSMTGWRLGYLAGPEEIINQASKMIDHTTSCACAISQKAAVAAFKYSDWVEESRRIFQKRRDLLFNGLSACPKITPFKSQGTFYMFCDIRKTGLNSFDFASKLLENHLVSCVPADAFGIDGFIRLSFSTSEEQITKGIERIKNFFQE